MEIQKSQPVDWVGQECLGFMVNAAFSDENTSVITSWLDRLNRVAPEGMYTMKPKGLHITLLDWVAPLLDYGGVDKRKLYEELRPEYDKAFRRITGEMKPFDVHFMEVRVTPGAVILVGEDPSQFNGLRSRFQQVVPLPEGGKEPPNIAHSSLIRFVPPAIDLAPVEAYAASHPIDVTQRISAFRLVETHVEPMQDFEVLDTYTLGG